MSERPTAMEKLRDAVDALFGKSAKRQPTDDEVFAVKRDFARAMPGADPVAEDELDRLLASARGERRYYSFYLRWIWREEASECRAAIRALPAERRTALFVHLLALKSYFGWDALTDVHEKPHTSSAKFFESFCEGVMIGLAETGFPVDAVLATQTLDWLARQCPMGYDLVTNGAYRPSRSLGAAKSIASAVAKGMTLPDSARLDALAVFDRWLNVDAVARETLLSKGETLEPAQRALLEIARCGAQDTFFRRMRALTPGRVAVKYPDLDPARWALYLDYHHEIRALVEDVKRAFAEGFASPSWLNDPAIFRATFDATEDEMVWPWWVCEGASGKPTPEVRARPGFSGLREDAGLKRIANPAFRSYTDDELEEFRSFQRGEINPSPFTFNGAGAPDIAAFTFEGSDPEGRLLDHLVSLDATKPSAKWLKTADEHIARIGAGKAFEGFARWLGHLHDLSLDNVDWDFAQEATMVSIRLSELCRLHARVSRDRDRRVALRRLALNGLAEAGIFLGPPVSRRPAMGDDARRDAEHRLRRTMSEPNVAIARGVIWALSRVADPRVSVLLEVAGREFYFKKYGDFRSKAAGNAVLWSLGQIGTLDAAFALARLRRAVRDKSVAKLVDAALEAAGTKVGLGLDDMRDLATPDYGVGLDGTRSERLGSYAVTLAVVSSRKATLTSLDVTDPKAKPKRGVPKAALADEAATALAAELAEAQSDIELLLPEARARLQNAWRGDRRWRLADWRERFLDNGLVATLSRRLIWRFETEAGEIEAIPRADGTILLVDGATAHLSGPETQVRLWHPLGAGSDDIAAWRERLKAIGVRQPFAQAWRASYLLTTAERDTRIYSNRFAGHILHQPPLIAILRKRGWIAASRVAYDPRSDAKPNRLTLPAFGVAAEFWFSGVGAASGPKPNEYGAPNYEYVTTDRLVFYALDAATGVLSEAPLPLDEVPAMAFSETLCDLETAIDATSIASDRFWSDRGAGAARPVSELPEAVRYRDAFAGANRGETQALRKAFLEALLPSLAIAERCHIDGDWLMVDGERANYRIHLGSGASQNAGTGRHLCIVPKSGEDDLAMLPFEGDTTLSLILSKAMLLASDDRIEDPSILAQLAA